MKLEDVFVGQRVGFHYDGKSLVGVVTNIENIPKDDEDCWVATVEGDDVIWDVNIKRLLGGCWCNRRCKMLKVTIRFTDKDHPYSYNDEDVLFVETVEEAEKICKERSWRRVLDGC